MYGRSSSFLRSVVLWMVLLAAGAASAKDTLVARIEAFIRAEQQRQGVVGLAVGVVHKGKVVLAKGYGSANLEHGVPVTADTIFQSGSLGKQFTAMAVMAQVEAGRLSLSDSITKFFPGAPAGWAPITVRHLLTHTSGIQDLEGEIDERKDYTDEDFVRYIAALPLEFAPGERWSYSNSGYVLLGILVNRVAGKFYGEVLAEQVFRPAGMKTARGISEDDIVPHRSSGYRREGDAVKHQTWVSPSLNATADGSLYFSVKDLVAWDAAVERRALLREESWREILSPVKLNSGSLQPYGFGWEVLTRAGQPLHRHTGAWQGFRTGYFRFLGERLSIIVLANTAQASTSRFAEGIAALVNPALAVPPLAPIPDTEPEVTAQAAKLMEQVRDGTVDPTRFAYVPKKQMSERLSRYQELLRKLGAPGPLVLVKREARGDDRIYQYQVRVGEGTYVLSMALIPDGRVSLFDVRAP